MSLEAELRYTRGAFHLDLALEIDGVGVLMGPTGSGKSTVLKLLLGVLDPLDGRIVARGRLLYDRRREIDRAPEDRRLAYVPHGFGLFPSLTVLDNVAFGIQHASHDQRRAHALDVLDGLDAIALADRYPSTLEPPARLQVALARALAVNPDALMLDEPLATLDPNDRPAARQLLADCLLALDIDAIVASRDAADARELAGRLFILEAGRLAQEGTPDEVAFRPATTFAGHLTAGLIERDSHAPAPRGRLSEDEE